MSKSYEEKYSPSNLSELILVQDARDIIENISDKPKDASKVYTLIGHSGIGKTTIARLIASKSKAAVHEINFSDPDHRTKKALKEAREILKNNWLDSHYPGKKNKRPVVILDEFHRLSKKEQEDFKFAIDISEHLIFIIANTDDLETEENKSDLPLLQKKIIHSGIISRSESIFIDPRSNQEYKDLEDQLYSKFTMILEKEKVQNINHNTLKQLANKAIYKDQQDIRSALRHLSNLINHKTNSMM